MILDKDLIHHQRAAIDDTFRRNEYQNPVLVKNLLNNNCLENLQTKTPINGMLTLIKHQDHKRTMS